MLIDFIFYKIKEIIDLLDDLGVIITAAFYKK